MNDSIKNIEIEFRSRFDEKKYNELKNFLSSNAQDLGEDDKDVYFFIFSDKLIKTVNNASKKNAKIVLKLNKIGKGSNFEEIEVPIAQEDFGKVTTIFKAVLTCDSMHTFQKRHNYLYKDVELALKWSEIWGYHLELEIVINSPSQKAETEKKIITVAEELGIKIMSDQELRKFTENAEADYKKRQGNS